MGFSRRFSMGGSLLAAVLSAGASAMARNPGLDDTGPAMPPMFTYGGYTNRAHGWSGKRKLKAWTKGQQPRRSKAQRRARAA